MCLITEMKVPTIAEKDITCYKVIRKDMSSLYHEDFKWELGKMYTSWMEVFEGTVNQAFHSYATLEDLKRAYFSATNPCLTVKCTIPKGSTVYTGTHDDLKGYASNKLIINEVIGIKELYPDFDWDNYPYEEGQVIQVKMPYSIFWHDIMYGIEHVKYYKKIWNDYQITNIQLYEGRKDSRVDLILENCETSDSNFIITKFDGEAWVADKEVRLKENKEE